MIAIKSITKSLGIYGMFFSAEKPRIAQIVCGSNDSSDHCDDLSLLNLNIKSSIYSVNQSSMSNLDLSNELDMGQFEVDDDSAIQDEHGRVTSRPFSIELTPQKKLSIIAKSSDEYIGQFNIASLHGKCAFILMRVNQGNSDEKQYLLLKRLDKSQESNHSVLEMYLKRNKFNISYDSFKILCGGEIVITKSNVSTWNIKSGHYSVKSEFDQNIIKKLGYKKSALQQLWLPQSCFRFFNTELGDSYDNLFTPNGTLISNHINQLEAYDDRTLKDPMTPATSDDSLDQMTL